MTSNVILFLTELAEYEPTLAGVSGFALAGYSTAVLTRLMANLQGKAKHYKGDNVIPHLSLTMNNAHYAYTAIQNSPLTKIVDATEMTNLEDMMQKAQERYLELTWATAVAKLRFDKDVKEDQLLKQPKLHKKQRMMLKHMLF